MDCIEINQEILLLQGAFCTQEHLRLNLDGSDSVSLRKAALIIVKTIREIEQINVRKSKQEINKSLHYVILSRTIFSNWESKLENEELEELAESSKKALHYVVTWPLYFECVRVAKWESLLEQTWRSFQPEIVHYICNRALDYVTARSKDSQNFGVICAAYRATLSENLSDEMFLIIESIHNYLRSFLPNLLQLPSTQHSSVTLQSFRMFSTVLARTNDWNADAAHVFRYSAMLKFWCGWIQEVIKVILQEVLADEKVVDVKEDIVSVARRCHGQVNAMVERKEWFGEEMVREAECCSRMLCESGLVSDEQQSHLERYLCDVQTKNSFWKGSLQKLLQRPDTLTNSKISNCLMENVTLDLEQAITLSRDVGINIIYPMVKNSFPRWPPKDIDLFISTHHRDKTQLSRSNEEHETKLTTLFNRLSACSKMEQNNTSSFTELCFADPESSIRSVLRFAMDCGNGDLVIWMMSSYPLTCRMKRENEEVCLLGRCVRSVLCDEDLTAGQEDNLKTVLMEVTQSNEVKTEFVECLKTFFYDVLLKQSLRNPNRRVLSIMPIFFDVVEKFADYDPVCLLVYFCRMLHCNLSIEASKVNAKSLADKEDIIAMMNRTTISVALRHTLRQCHVIRWLSCQLDKLDPRVSYYLYGFLKDTLEQELLKFSDFSGFTLPSLVTFACCVPNSNILGHISTYLKTSEHAYWELKVCVLKLLPSSTKKEFRSIVSLLSGCGHLVPKTAFGLLTDAILTLTNTSDLTRECCANLIENYSYSIQELIKDLEDDGTFVSVFLDACRLLTDLPQYLKPLAKAIVLELAARCSGELREVLRIAVQNLDGSSEEMQQVLKVFSD